MSELTCLVFDEPGPGNTSATIAIAARRAQTLAIAEVVVATTTGRTALAAKQAMPQCRVIGVTLQAGLWRKYAGPDPQIVAEAEAAGVQMLTCPHALMGSLDSAVTERFGGPAPGDFAAYVYYTLSQGTKVAVECALMAADSGLLSMDRDVLSLAGSNQGCDTALVITPAYTHQFFDLRIREVLAKPR